MNIDKFFSLCSDKKDQLFECSKRHYFPTYYFIPRVGPEIRIHILGKEVVAYQIKNGDAEQISSAKLEQIIKE